jgi:type I restriction enzyme, S subunit
LENSIEKLAESSHGSTMKHIKKGVLDEFHCPIPPLPEQKKIASILTSVDEVIEKTQSQIDKLQDLKKGTMNELLTKGIGHTEFKDSELGRIPKSWVSTTIDDVTLDVTYGLTVRPAYQEQGVPLVSGKECKDGWIDFSIANLISEIDFTNLRERTLPKKGDVIFTKTGTLGRVALVEKWYPKFAISQNVALITPDTTKIIPEFLKILCMSQNIQEQTKMGASTLSVQDLQLGILRKFRIPVPSFDEQENIISILSALGSNIDINKKRLQRHQSLKKSLMQDLLTGKVRVSVN